MEPARRSPFFFPDHLQADVPFLFSWRSLGGARELSLIKKATAEPPFFFFPPPRRGILVFVHRFAPSPFSLPRKKRGDIDRLPRPAPNHEADPFLLFSGLFAAAADSTCRWSTPFPMTQSGVEGGPFFFFFFFLHAPLTGDYSLVNGCLAPLCSSFFEKERRKGRGEVHTSQANGRKRISFPPRCTEKVEGRRKTSYAESELKVPLPPPLFSRPGPDSLK